jgi:hypothetical protein
MHSVGAICDHNLGVFTVTDVAMENADAVSPAHPVPRTPKAANPGLRTRGGSSVPLAFRNTPGRRRAASAPPLPKAEAASHAVRRDRRCTGRANLGLVGRSDRPAHEKLSAVPMNTGPTRSVPTNRCRCLLLGSRGC